MHRSWYESGAHTITKREFTEMGKARVFSRCVCVADSQKNKFAVYAKATFSEDKTVWYAVVNQKQNLAMCASIDAVHQLAKSAGVSQLDIQAEGWDATQALDPHKNSTNSRRRHRLRKEMQCSEHAILALMVENMQDQSRSSLEGQLRQVCESEAHFSQWVRGEVSLPPVLNAAVTMAMKAGLHPRTELELYLFLKSALYVIPGKVDEAVMRAAYPCGFWAHVQAGVGKIAIETAVSDMVILRAGGYV